MIETYEDLLDAITEVSDVETAQLFHKYATETASLEGYTAKGFFGIICKGMLIPSNSPKARFIDGAFTFSLTPEGHDFWRDISNKVKNLS